MSSMAVVPSNPHCVHRKYRISACMLGSGTAFNIDPYQRRTLFPDARFQPHADVRAASDADNHVQHGARQSLSSLAGPTGALNRR
jgi:hypothetical protein